MRCAVSVITMPDVIALTEDARLAKFPRRGLGQTDQASLGGRIVGLTELAAHALALLTNRVGS